MSYSIFKSVDFGSGRTGLATVGYALYSIAGGLGSRITAGVAEIIDGKYGALVTFPASFRGALVWDSGEVSPIYANDVINPETAENVDAKVSSMSSTPIDINTLVAAIINAMPNFGNAVWDALAASHIGSGTTGELLKKLDVGLPTSTVVIAPRATPATTRYPSAADPSKIEITFVAKLRWVEKRPNEQMVIRNFEALRLMCMAITHEKKEEWPQAKAAQAQAQDILDEELKDYLAGQQLTMPMATGPDFGFSDIGGAL